jgi:hypothetical protein
MSDRLISKELYYILFIRINGFLDFVHHSEFWISENTTFRKLDDFPSLMGTETETDPVSETFVCSSIQNSGRWTESRNPVILSGIHHHQNPVNYTCCFSYLHSLFFWLVRLYASSSFIFRFPASLPEVLFYVEASELNLFISHYKHIRNIHTYVCIEACLKF